MRDTAADVRDLFHPIAHVFLRNPNGKMPNGPYARLRAMPLYHFRYKSSSTNRVPGECNRYAIDRLSTERSHFLAMMSAAMKSRIPKLM